MRSKTQPIFADFAKMYNTTIKAKLAITDKAQVGQRLRVSSIVLNVFKNDRI